MNESISEPDRYMLPILCIILLTNGALFYSIGAGIGGAIIFCMGIWLVFGNKICLYLDIYQGDKKPNSLRRDMP